MVDGVCHRYTRGLSPYMFLLGRNIPTSLTWRSQAGRPKGSRDKQPRLCNSRIPADTDNLTQQARDAKRASDVDVRHYGQYPTFDSESAAHWRHQKVAAAPRPTPYFSPYGAAVSPVYGAHYALTTPYQWAALPHTAGLGLGRDHDRWPRTQVPVPGQAYSDDDHEMRFEAPSTCPSARFNFSPTTRPCQRAPELAALARAPEVGGHLGIHGSHGQRECGMQRYQEKKRKQPELQAPTIYQRNPTFEHQLAALAPTIGQGCASPSLSDSDGRSTLAAARSDIDLAREVVSAAPHRQPTAGSGCAAATETFAAVVMGPDCFGVQKSGSRGRDAASAADESELDPFWMDWQPWLVSQVQNLSTG